MSEASTDDAAGEASKNDAAREASSSGSRGKSRTSEEDAAVVIAILTALTAGSAASAGRSGPASVWADPGHLLRTRLSTGNGSWWASGLPR